MDKGKRPIKLKIVARKFIDEMKLAIPERINPLIMISTATGDRLMREVDKGGYKVQPVPPQENSEVVERITHPQETASKNIEKLLMPGNPTSGDEINNGRK